MNPNRYLCQFRDLDQDYFITDCAFEHLGQAWRYVRRIVTALASVAEGQIFDAETREIVKGPISRDNYI